EPIQGRGRDQVLVELRRLKDGGTKAPAGDQPLSRCPPEVVSAANVAHSLMAGPLRAVAELSSPWEAATEKNAPTPKPGPSPSPETPSPQAQALSLSSGSLALPGQSGAGQDARAKRQTYWQSVARVGVQVADALEHAHKQGVVHRDIKPSNLLLDLQGTVWVTDFGLAKADDQQNLTHTGDFIGTLRYMAPERFSGQGDLRSDIYSLGLTLYELLTFRPAFDESDSNRLVKQVMHDEPPRPRKVNPGVPRDLETVVLKAIAREP